MKITQPSRRRAGLSGTRLRLAVSLAVGAVVAGGLVAWDDLHNHAALVAAAAAPEPKGVHETVGSILATGGIFTFLVVAVVVFAVATVLARRRNARSARTRSAPVSPGGTASPQPRVRAVVADGHRHETGPDTGQPRRHLGRHRAGHLPGRPRDD